MVRSLDSSLSVVENHGYKFFNQDMIQADFVVWRMAWKRSTVEARNPIRRLLQQSRQEKSLVWVWVLKVETEKNGWIRDIFWW